MLRRIASNGVKKGMFVAQLDRPWIESPFLIQGFLVESDEEILQLQQFSRFVMIDTSLSDLREEPPTDQKFEPELQMAEITLKKVTSPAAAINGNVRHSDEVNSTGGQVSSLKIEDPKDLEKRKQRQAAAAPLRLLHDSLGINGSFILYTEESTVEEEFEVASAIHSELSGALREAFDNLHAKGQLELEGIQASTQELVESMLRNPDAAHLLSQLKQKDSYSYSHSVEAAVLGVLFGRHLGVTKRELDDLALGILLLDVGKTCLPTGLLEKKSSLNGAEVKLIKKHVQMGLGILEGNERLSRDVIDIVKSHHERFDGKGYPLGKEGLQISVFGRIAAIIDFYDAVTHDRPYRRRVKPAAAINALYARRGTHFQSELVEEFIQCLGLYPTGTLVELSSGEIGIVIEQNRLRRLRPKVLVVLDELKQHLDVPFTRDLDLELVDHVGKKLMITQALDSDAYGISKEDYYL